MNYSMYEAFKKSNSMFLKQLKAQFDEEEKKKSLLEEFRKELLLGEITEIDKSKGYDHCLKKTRVHLVEKYNSSLEYRKFFVEKIDNRDVKFTTRDITFLLNAVYDWGRNRRPELKLSKNECNINQLTSANLKKIQVESTKKDKRKKINKKRDTQINFEYEKIQKLQKIRKICDLDELTMRQIHYGFEACYNTTKNEIKRSKDNSEDIVYKFDATFKKFKVERNILINLDNLIQYCQFYFVKIKERELNLNVTVNNQPNFDNDKIKIQTLNVFRKTIILKGLTANQIDLGFERCLELTEDDLLADSEYNSELVGYFEMVFSQENPQLNFEYLELLVPQKRREEAAKKFIYTPQQIAELKAQEKLKDKVEPSSKNKKSQHNKKEYISRPIIAPNGFVELVISEVKNGMRNDQYDYWNNENNMYDNFDYRSLHDPIDNTDFTN